MEKNYSMPPISETSVRTRIGKLINGVLLAITVAGLGQSSVAMADAVSDAELKVLPPFCEARLRRTPAYDQWRKSLGVDYEHTHHYCMGMIYLNRYPSLRTDKAKRSTLNDAMGNLSYMISHASPGYSLMPDVYFSRAQAFAYRDEIAGALNDLLKAIELNPKMTRAYVLAADLLIKSKQSEKALKLVTTGLRENPDHRALQRVYDQLGGSKPYPERVTEMPNKDVSASTKEAAVKEEVPATAMADTVPSTRAETLAPNPSSTANQKAETQQKNNQNTDSASSKVTPIGTPTNPWCRFCPDSK